MNRVLGLKIESRGLQNRKKQANFVRPIITFPEIMTIPEIFRSIGPVSDASIAEVEEQMEYCTFKKGEALIKQGERAIRIFFLEEGIVRLFFSRDGKERTVCFGVAGDPFTSVCSLKSGDCSLYGFEAMSDCSAWAISIERFREIVAKNPEINNWFIALMLTQLEALVKRSVMFGTLNASGRYETFVLKRKEILLNVPAKYIAQYLEVAPETLSRIMAVYAKK